MHRVLIALLLAVGVLPSTVTAAAGVHQSHKIFFFPPGSNDTDSDHSSGNVPTPGNRPDKDNLDARLTTMPECRMIDPTDRETKYACLVGQWPASHLGAATPEH